MAVLNQEASSWTLPQITPHSLFCTKGQVGTVISDCGLQLQSADKEMIEWRRGCNSTELRKFGADKCLDRKFVMQQFQHQKGAAEIMVKLMKGIKVACLRVLGYIKLTYNETNTMFFEIAELYNQRHIGLKKIIIHGHRVPLSEQFILRESFTDDPGAVATMFHLVQSITNQFWRIWNKLFFPSLLIRRKWHTTRRNVQV